MAGFSFSRGDETAGGVRGEPPPCSNLLPFLGIDADESRRYRIDSASSQGGVTEVVATGIPAVRGEAPSCVRYTPRWNRAELDSVKREGRICETTTVRNRSFRRAS